MVSSTAKNLKAIVKAVEQHDGSCKEKAKAVALSPYEHDRLGFDSVSVNGRSVPLKTDDSLGTGRFRVICDGYHGPKHEEEVEDTVDAPAPAERELVPARTPPTGDELVSYAKGLGLRLTPAQEQFFKSFGRDSMEPDVQLYGGGHHWSAVGLRDLSLRGGRVLSRMRDLGIVIYKFPDH